jgi:D-alanyl-D-alanine carboxypeptidase
MKKILLILISSFLGYAVSAQISNPEKLNPDNHRLTKDVPSQPMNPDHVSGRTQNSFVSPSFDANWANRFQTVLDSTVAATGAKGASAAVLVPGQGLWTGVSGISSEGVPITSEMRFGFGSNTKLYIAVTLAKLQEEGVLSLDDPLYQWIPAYAFVDSTATIRQLLSHQTGIFDFANDQWNFFWNLILSDTSHFFTPEEVLATIGNPHFDPGNGFRYSNTNYLLAGMIIEAASGESWIQKLHDVIFDPLTMDSTFVGAFEPRNGPVANEWVIGQWEDVNTPMTSAYTSINSAGAIFSTPQEMVKWYQALFNGDIISEASLEEVLDFETTSTFGLGIAEYMLDNKHYMYYHGGAMVGYLSEIDYDVQTKSVFCVVQTHAI